MIRTTRMGRDQERQARVVDRVRDEHRPIERDLELHARRQRLLDAGRASRMRRATSMRFALDCRTTPMATAGMPL